MQYRQREDNYVFWQDKFSRCSLDIPGAGVWGVSERTGSIQQLQLVRKAHPGVSKDVAQIHVDALIGVSAATLQQLGSPVFWESLAAACYKVIPNNHIPTLTAPCCHCLATDDCLICPVLLSAV
jgi:hypothetical protein